VGGRVGGLGPGSWSGWSWWPLRGGASAPRLVGSVRLVGSPVFGAGSAGSVGWLFGSVVGPVVGGDVKVSMLPLMCEPGS
jgi:hypothetical protein